MDKSNKIISNEDFNLTKLEIMLKSPLAHSDSETAEILRLLDKAELIYYADKSDDGKNVNAKMCSLKSGDGRLWAALFTNTEAFAATAAAESAAVPSKSEKPLCIGVRNFFEQICREVLRDNKFSGIIINPDTDACAIASEHISKYISKKKLAENSRHIKAAEELMERREVDTVRLISELNQIYLAFASKKNDGKMCGIAVDAKSKSGTYYGVFTTADELIAMLNGQGIEYDEIKGKKNLRGAVEFALKSGYDGIAVNPSRHKVVIDRENLEKIFKDVK